MARTASDGSPVYGRGTQLIDMMMSADDDTPQVNRYLLARKLLSKLPFAKLSRFGAIGAINTATYAILSSGLIGSFGVEATLSSAISFAVCLPLAFWSHKLVTFRSGKRSRDEFFKFVSIQSASFAIATISMFICVHLLGLHHIIPILLTIVIVPVVSFVVLDRWVFKTPKPL